MSDLMITQMTLDDLCCLMNSLIECLKTPKQPIDKGGNIDNLLGNGPILQFIVCANGLKDRKAVKKILVRILEIVLRLADTEKKLEDKALTKNISKLLNISRVTKSPTTQLDRGMHISDIKGPVIVGSESVSLSDQHGLDKYKNKIKDLKTKLEIIELEFDIKSLSGDNKCHIKTSLSFPNTPTEKAFESNLPESGSVIRNREFPSCKDSLDSESDNLKSDLNIEYKQLFEASELKCRALQEQSDLLSTKSIMLSQVIDDYKDDIENMRRDLNDRNAERECNNKHIKYMQDEIDELKRTNEHITESNDDKELQMKRNERKNKGDMDKLMAINKQVELQLEDLRKLTKHKEEKSIVINTELKLSSNECLDLKNEIDGLHKRISEKDTLIAELQETINESRSCANAMPEHETEIRH